MVPDSVTWLPDNENWLMDGLLAVPLPGVKVSRMPLASFEVENVPAGDEPLTMEAKLVPVIVAPPLRVRMRQVCGVCQNATLELGAVAEPVNWRVNDAVPLMFKPPPVRANWLKLVPAPLVVLAPRFQTRLPVLLRSSPFCRVRVPTLLPG